MPVEPVALDIVAAQARELRVETVFRYANVFDRALSLIASGAIDLKPLITGAFDFEDSVAAFESAAEGRPDDVKIQIHMPAFRAEWTAGAVFNKIRPRNLARLPAQRMLAHRFEA